MDAQDINPAPDRARNREIELIERACVAMTDATGLEFKFQPAPPGQTGDTRETVFVQRKGTQIARYRVQIREPLTLAAAMATALEIGGQKKKLLFIAKHVPKNIAEQLRAEGFQFIDTAANAYLDAGGLYVFIAGGVVPKEDRQEKRLPRKPRAFATAGLKILFVLLCDPAFANGLGTLREIGKRAGVALGTVHQVIEDLKNLGHLAVLPGGDQRLRDREKLLLRWADHYPLQLRPKLNPRRFTTADTDWWRNTDIVKYGGCWGGETAAALLTDHLRPEIATIYATAMPAQLIAERRMRPDPRGNVEILEKFWHFEDLDHPAIVPPLLAYADLLFTGDGRNIEAAAYLHEKYLARPGG